MGGTDEHARIAADQVALDDEHERVVALAVQSAERELRCLVQRVPEVVAVGPVTGGLAGPELAGVGTALIGRVLVPEQLARQFVIHADEEACDEFAVGHYQVVVSVGNWSIPGSSQSCEIFPSAP